MTQKEKQRHRKRNRDTGRETDTPKEYISRSTDMVKAVCKLVRLKVTIYTRG